MNNNRSHIFDVDFMNKNFKLNAVTQAIYTTVCLTVLSPVVHAEKTAAEELVQLPTITLVADQHDTTQGQITEGTGSFKAKSSRSSTRLKLDIKETPQSVSVVTREQIEQRNLNIIDDVLDATPGVFVTKMDSERSSYYARGYKIGNQQIDGLAIAENGPRTDSFFFDRVEVIKGAAGLTGSTGDPSATINMIRKRPSKELSGYAATSIGSWDTIRTEADISVPLTQDGRVRSRVMGAYRDGDSYMDYYSLQSAAAMAIVEADLTDQLTASVGFQYQENKPQGSTWGTVPYWYADGSLANLPRNFSLANRWNTINESDRTVFADLNYRFDNDWIVKAAATYSFSKSFWLMSYGGSGFPKQDGTGMGVWSMISPTSESKKTSLELYASGPFKLFDRQHELIVGANGYNRRENSPGGEFIGGGNSQLTCTKTDEDKNIFPSSSLEDNCIINDWQSWDGNATTKPDYRVIPAERDRTQRNYGVYSTLRLNLADPLKLIIGGRQSYYKASNGSRADIDKNKFTPYVGITYDINKQYTAYASYTDMFNPSTNKDRDNNYLEPELSKSYELGIKGTFFDDQLLASAAAFWSKKENVAVKDYEAIKQGIKVDGADPMMASGSGLDINGFEIEAVGEILPDWNISAGYTYVNSVSSPEVAASTTIPQNQAKLYSSLKLPNSLWDGADKVSIGLGLNWQSDLVKYVPKGAPPNSDATMRQDAYFLANAHITYKFNEMMSAGLQVNNLFDKEYYQNIGFYNGVYWGEPRKVTFTLRTRF